MDSLILTSLTMGLIIGLVLLHRRLRSRSFKAKTYLLIWLLISLRLLFFMDLSLKTSYKLEPVKLKPVKLEEGLGEIGEERPRLEEGKPLEKAGGKRDIRGLILANLNIIWLSGASLYLVFNLGFYLVFKARLKRSSQALEDPLFYRIKKDLRLEKRVDLYESEAIDSPMVVGILRPSLVLPVDFKLDRLGYVYYHELIHIASGDLHYKLLVFTVSGIHWFNPLVHRMKRAVDQDLELKCDLRLLEILGEDSREDYGKTLVDSIGYRKLPSLVSSYGGGKKMIKRRIDNIFSTIKFKSGKGLLALSLVLILSLSFLVGCQKTVESDPSLYSFKTDYLGNNSKISGLVNSLEFSKDYDFMELATSQQPYGLRLYFKEDLDKEDINKMNKTSAIIFSLVGNLDYIDYVSLNNMEYRVKRENMDSFTMSVLGYRLEELGKNELVFKKLENLKLESHEEEKQAFDDSQSFESLEENLVYRFYYDKNPNAGLKDEEDSFTLVAPEVLGSYREGDLLYIYSRVRRDQVMIKEGRLETASGYMEPNLLIFKNQGQDYVLEDHIVAEDGSYFMPSIEKMTEKHPEMKEKMYGENNSINQLARQELEKLLKKNSIRNYDLGYYK